MTEGDFSSFEDRAERAMSDLERAVEAVVRICDATDSLARKIAMRTLEASLAASAGANPTAYGELCDALAGDLREYAEALSTEVPAYECVQTDALAACRKLADAVETDSLSDEDVAGVVQGMQDYREATNGGKAKVRQVEESIATLEGPGAEFISARVETVVLLERFAEALRCGAEEARLAQRAWKRVAARRTSD